MDPITIASLVVLGIKEAPLVLALFGKLIHDMSILGHDLASGTAPDPQRGLANFQQFLRIGEQILGTALAANFGDSPAKPKALREFEYVRDALIQESAGMGKPLDLNMAETITQLLQQQAAPAPILQPQA